MRPNPATMLAAALLTAVTSGAAPAPPQATPEADAGRPAAVRVAPPDRLPSGTVPSDTVQAEKRHARQARWQQQARQQRQAAEAAHRQAVERQQVLADLGWYHGPIDGIVGPVTRAAIGDLQQAAGLEVTSTFDPETVDLLASGDAPPRPEPEPEPEPAPAAAAPASREARAAAIADALPYSWRDHGVTIRVGCHPDVRCSWGVYDYRTRQVWLSPDAFATGSRLQYVVTHEMVHAWQWNTDLPSRKHDLAAWGHTGMGGLERAADCLARVWGASQQHYWNCPADAQAHMRDVWQSTR